MADKEVLNEVQSKLDAISIIINDIDSELDKLENKDLIEKLSDRWVDLRKSKNMFSMTVRQERKNDSSLG